MILITATWTVDTVKGRRGPISARTSELQAVWRLVPPKTVFYACANNPQQVVGRTSLTPIRRNSFD